MKYTVAILAVLLFGCDVSVTAPIPEAQAQEKEENKPKGAPVDGETYPVEEPGMYGDIDADNLPIMLFYMSLCTFGGTVDFDCVEQVITEQVTDQKKTYEDAIELRDAYRANKKEEKDK